MKIDFPPEPTSFGRIRAAEPADTPAILRMAGRLAAHHGDDCGLTADHIARDVFAPEPLICLLVAEAQTGLIGYAGLFGIAQFHFGRRGLELHHLFVEAEGRGQGVGQALIRASLTAAQGQGCSYVMVGTDPDNLAAQAFYTGLGFERRASFPPRFVYRLEA
ncbi:GNAT family N-acetyltransferase [Pseudodonghicola sp.]|uniref:GNAT family N-acetyltransferase n=1 Tax=Pseudodonghicola sp. TaxID=1969463 RepID=UPI003A98387E